MNITISLRQAPANPDFVSVYDVCRIIGSSAVYENQNEVPYDQMLIQDKMYIHPKGLRLIAERIRGRGGDIQPSKLERLAEHIEANNQTRHVETVYEQIDAIASELTPNQLLKISRKHGFTREVLGLAHNKRLAEARRTKSIYVAGLDTAKLLTVLSNTVRFTPAAPARSVTGQE